MTKDRRPIRVYKDGAYSILRGWGRADAEVIEALKPDEPVEITIKQRRSLPQLQSYWCMLDRVVEATEAYPTAEKLHEALKMALGYYTTMKRLDGHILVVPDSVAFNKMSAPDFRAYFQKAEKLIAETFGIDVNELRKAA